MTLDDLELNDLVAENEEIISDPANNLDDEPELEDKEPAIDSADDLDDLEPEDVVKTTDNEDDIEDKDDTASVFFDYLKSKNIVVTNENFEFDGSEEKLEEALLQTKDNVRLEVFESLMNRLPDNVQDVIKFSLQSGGRDLNDYMQFNQAIDWDNLDTSREDVQRSIMEHYYRNVSNYDDYKIKRHIDRLEKAGDLAEEAINVIDELKDLEAQSKEDMLLHYQQQQAAMEEQNRVYRLAIQDSISKASYLEEARKQKIKNFLFNEKRTRDGSYTDYNLALNNISKSPDHMAQLADLLLDYNKDTGFDFSRFTQKAKTAAVKNLRAQLDEIKSNAKVGMNANPSKTTKPDFDLASYLHSLK